jgi:hypothetical protein
MFSVPEGRAANHPLAETTFRPPIGASISRSTREFARDRFAGQFGGCYGFGRKLLELVLLLGRGRGVNASVVRCPELGGQFLVVHPGILSSTRCDFRGEQAEDETVFIGVLHTVPFCRRKLAPALSSPPKQHEPSNRPGVNHLKPTGTSQSLRSRLPTTRSMSRLLTKVLPTTAPVDHFGR